VAGRLDSYRSKRLNQIVIPGAHDAGVYTANTSFTRTQSLDIGAQAADGCRFFDLRIAARANLSGGVTHRAFHADPFLVRSLPLTGNRNVQKFQMLSGFGAWGGKLTDILDQAADFVDKNPTEFLILKFSKCFNWPDIARTCAQRLTQPKDVWYRPKANNLNVTQVKDLCPKVITLFDVSAKKELDPIVASLGQHGIIYFQSLFDGGTGKTYVPNPKFPLMQYFGKFSSTPNIDTNTQKQRDILLAGAPTHPDVIGMMYWTTTGATLTTFLSSIKERNDRMWSKTNVDALQKTWETGLKEAIEDRLGNRARHDPSTISAGSYKSFMPNIVMMDFVNSAKCDTVYQLNDVAGQELKKLRPKPLPKPLPKPTAGPTLRTTNPATPPRS
jgi:hypothetical protein